MMRPGAPSGLSVLLMEAHPSDELGALVLWRNRAAPAGLGFRAGVADGAGGDLAVMFGVDISGSLGRLGSGGGQPDVIWWSGAGVGVGNEAVVSVPLGLVLGWQVAEESVSFAPHVGGHASLDFITGSGDDVDVDATVDLGVDLGFGSGFVARFGASVGGRDALGFGVRIPG
jgi:hypothetical protein